MIKRIIRLRQTITTPTLKGIFFNLASSGEFEFINNDSKRQLNIDYYEIYSREKIASPYFNIDGDDNVYVDDDDIVYVDDFDYVITPREFDDLYQTLSDIVISRYKDKWNRLYDVLVNAEYKPLENYNMKEKRTPNTTDTRNVKTNSDITSVTDNDKYGYNSSSASPYDKSTIHTTGDEDDNTIFDELKRTGYEELERSGNIGVTTSQQMLESEIKLRALNNMVKIMFDDIDKVLTTPIYK